MTIDGIPPLPEREQDKPLRNYKCSQCGERGHNARSCGKERAPRRTFGRTRLPKGPR